MMIRISNTTNTFFRCTLLMLVTFGGQGVDGFLASYICNMVISQFTDEVDCGCALTWSLSGGMGVIADCTFDEDFTITSFGGKQTGGLFELDLIGKPLFHGEYYWRGTRTTSASFDLQDQMVDINLPPFPKFTKSIEFESFKLVVEHDDGLEFGLKSCQAYYNNIQCKKCGKGSCGGESVEIDCSGIVLTTINQIEVKIPEMTNCIDAGVIPSMYGPTDTYAPFVPYMN